MSNSEDDKKNVGEKDEEKPKKPPLIEDFTQLTAAARRGKQLKVIIGGEHRTIEVHATMASSLARLDDLQPQVPPLLDENGNQIGVNADDPDYLRQIARFMKLQDALIIREGVPVIREQLKSIKGKKEGDLREELEAQYDFLEENLPPSVIRDLNNLCRLMTFSDAAAVDFFSEGEIEAAPSLENTAQSPAATENP